tara:strand:- start:2953 stop:3774 length:822 start_codon:yes stop_codon:yes gene_type:complete
MSKTNSSDELKKLVLEKYDQIGKNASDKSKTSGCCGDESSGLNSIDYEVFAEDYTTLQGYQLDADLGLGCGLPTEFAQIKEGNTVVDLGSGAGNDCFVARQLTGDSGRVIGVDFSPSMVAKARENVKKLGFTNIEFFQGDIEDLPLPDQTADVVVSNCVLNLVPDKQKAFGETYRVLKNGGHFSISDVVVEGDLPADIRKSAEMYAGCVSGAIELENYLSIVRKSGFKNLTLQKKREIVLPDSILEQFLSPSNIVQLKESGAGIYSITLYAEK